MVVAYSVHRDGSVNIEDAYAEKGFDFSGTKNFDAQDRLSFAFVPDGADEGSRRRSHRRVATDQCQGSPKRRSRPFSEADQRLAESLASQAAVALTNRQLINRLEGLFESSSV